MGFTVAGTVPDSHRIPFYATHRNGVASPNRGQMYVFPFIYSKESVYRPQSFHLKKRKTSPEGLRPGLPFRPRTEYYPSSATLLSVVGRSQGKGREQMPAEIEKRPTRQVVTRPSSRHRFEARHDKCGFLTPIHPLRGDLESFRRALRGVLYFFNGNMSVKHPRSIGYSEKKTYICAS